MFRLIEETETYQVTYDEGPGSMMYPDVIKSKTRVLREWSGNGLTKEEMLAYIKEHYDHFIPTAWDSGTFYYLERSDDGFEWKFVAQV